MTTGLLVPAKDAYVLFTDRLAVACTLDELDDRTLEAFKDKLQRSPERILDLQDARKAFVSDRFATAVASRHAYAAVDAARSLTSPLTDRSLVDAFTSVFEENGYDGSPADAARDSVIVLAHLDHGVFSYEGTRSRRCSSVRFGSGAAYLDDSVRGVGEFESGMLDADHAVEFGHPWFSQAVERDLFSSGVEYTLLAQNGSSQQVLEAPQLEQSLRPYLRSFRSARNANAFDLFEKHYASTLYLRSRLGP